MSAAEHEAWNILRDLLAGADDHRCWYVPTEIRERAEALISEPHPTAARTPEEALRAAFKRGVESEWSRAQPVIKDLRERLAAMRAGGETP